MSLAIVNMCNHVSTHALCRRTLPFISTPACSIHSRPCVVHPHPVSAAPLIRTGAFSGRILSLHHASLLISLDDALTSQSSSS